VFDYYAIRAEEFHLHRPYQFNLLETHADLCKLFAREVVDLILANAARGEMTKLILPVGPLDYQALPSCAIARG
jgi:hypothetical protein